jgi:hypothetical protein
MFSHYASYGVSRYSPTESATSLEIEGEYDAIRGAIQPIKRKILKQARKIETAVTYVEKPSENSEPG